MFDGCFVQGVAQGMERLSGNDLLWNVPGATHLFEEPGALEEVARLAREWFIRCLAGTLPEEKKFARRR